jgi:uncharacterized 2Fe-2S/4Fe-4S cluster protein (DUF4445 family)
MKKPKKKGKKSKKKRSPFKSFPNQKPKKRYVWLNVLPDDLWLKVRRGKTILEALEKTDVAIATDCGGLGQCGKCKLRILSSIGPPPKETAKFLTNDEVVQGVRLACRTKIKKDLSIYVGEADSDEDYFQILKTGERPMLYLDPLLKKQRVILAPESYFEGIPDLDRIKMALGPEYLNLEASLTSLRNLPGILQRNRTRGTAVLQNHYLLDYQDVDRAEQSYGLVFDLGTSTLVGKLINLIAGTEIAAISRLNSQHKFGSDVISRLKYIMEHRDGLEQLHDLLIKDINLITRRLLEVHKLKPKDIFIGVAAGNTTMQHLLLKLNPTGIAGAPFAPIVTNGLKLKASKLGLNLHPEAQLYVMPCKSGYIGGDLISTILASGAAEQDDAVILGLDLGTNGEIFLGNRKRMLTCSAAAGPALEGAKITHGMIAKSGAIEGVYAEENTLKYKVIGNLKPKGMCGSGIVDLAAVLLHCGYINYEGLIENPEIEDDNLYNMRVLHREDVNDFLIVSKEESYHNKDIFLTQKDVRELQLAKGAVAAGIDILMNELGIGVEDVQQIHLAGALGNYIHPFSALRIGLIPSVNPEIIKPLGNAASTGGSMVLLSKTHWNMAEALAKRLEHIELSTRSDFNQKFIEHLDFPKENIW